MGHGTIGTPDGNYAVKIEPSKIGGYMVTITGPGIQLADVEHVATVEEGREWAREHVAWIRHKEPTVEFTL